MVEESIRPLQEELETIVRHLLGTAVEDELVRLSALSVASQCVFYQHCRSIISRLFPGQNYGSKEINKLVEHVTRFSLAAIKSSPRERQGKQR